MTADCHLMPESHDKDASHVAHMRLGDLVRPAMVVRVQCGYCLRTGPLNLIALLASYGHTIRLAEIGPNLKCRGCGARGLISFHARHISE